MQTQIAAGFARLVQAVNKAVAPTWWGYIPWPSTAAGVATVGGQPGKVRAHTRGAVTVYRFIPDVANPALDAFYSGYAGGVLSGLIASRG